MSASWRDEAEQILKAELTPEMLHNITSSMVNIHHNCPDGKDMYLYINYKDGVLDQILVGDGDAPHAEFYITGDYKVYVDMSFAKISSEMALITGKLKLKGNMLKALKLAFIADKINRTLDKIPTDY